MAGVRSWCRPATMIVAAAAFMLSACGTSQQPGSKPSQQAAKAPAQDGSYKVGNPYRISGDWYHPVENLSYDETEVVSWYGQGIQGRRTANGERYNQRDINDEHTTLTKARLR